MVRAAVDAIGGIGRFVQRGDVVVIKPNVAFERPAVLGATTHPEVLTALIHLVREAGAAEIRVADNPIESPQSCFIATGIQQAAVAAGARVFLPSRGRVRDAERARRHLDRELAVLLAARSQGANKVIGVAPVKDHNLCRASMTTKNWYGLLGGRRNQFHQDIHGIIADLALMLRPTFVLLDGSRVLFRSGPTGGSLSDVKAGPHHRRLDRLAGRRRLRLGQPARAQGRGAARLLRDAPPPRKLGDPGLARPPRQGGPGRMKPVKLDRPAEAAQGRRAQPRRHALVRARRAHHQLAHRLAGLLLRAVRLPALGDLVLAAWAATRSRCSWRSIRWSTFATALSTHTVYRWLWRAMWILIPTLLLGRVFCGWICPYGTLHQFVGWLFNIRRNRHNIEANAYRPIFQLKYSA